MLTITIAKTHTLPVDESRFTTDVNAFIWNYGLKQLLNDAGATVEDGTPEERAAEKLAKATARLEQLYTGTLRKPRETSLGVSTLDALFILSFCNIFSAFLCWLMYMTLALRSRLIRIPSSQ